MRLYETLALRSRGEYFQYIEEADCGITIIATTTAEGTFQLKAERPYTLRIPNGFNTTYQTIDEAEQAVIALMRELKVAYDPVHWGIYEVTQEGDYTYIIEDVMVYRKAIHLLRTTLFTYGGRLEQLGEILESECLWPGKTLTLKIAMLIEDEEEET